MQTALHHLLILGLLLAPLRMVLPGAFGISSAKGCVSVMSNDADSAPTSPFRSPASGPNSPSEENSEERLGELLSHLIARDGISPCNREETIPHPPALLYQMHGSMDLLRPPSA